MAVVLDNTAAPRHPEKAHRPDQPAPPKPDWIRVKAPVSKGYVATQAIVRAHGLHTVCEEASCPNIGECWEQRHATMPTGKTGGGVAGSAAINVINDTTLAYMNLATVSTSTVGKLGLKHVVVTSVDRDDPPDGGAAHFAAVIAAIRAACPATTVEVLTPDFLR